MLRKHCSYTSTINSIKNLTYTHNVMLNLMLYKVKVKGSLMQWKILCSLSEAFDAIKKMTKHNSVMLNLMLYKVKVKGSLMQWPNSMFIVKSTQS